MRNKLPTRLSFAFFGLKSVTMSAHIPFMHNLTVYFLSDHDHSEAWLVVTNARTHRARKQLTNIAYPLIHLQRLEEHIKVISNISLRV